MVEAAEENSERMSLRRLAPVLILIAGASLRLLHNAALVNSPLYYVPLGGHTVFFVAARAIFDGDLLPGDRPFTDNSPLYPYLIAFGYLLGGSENFFFARILTIVVDVTVIVLIMKIAKERFGEETSLWAGVLYAIFGPAIFFSCELIYIAYALAFLSLSMLLAFRDRIRSQFFAGLHYGFAIAAMPSLALGIPLLILSPIMLWGRRAWRQALAVLCGSSIVVAAIAFANYANSGAFVLLTTSAGHNFYIGHNPEAQAAYYLPEVLSSGELAIRGTTFDTMKKLAETAEGRTFQDTEVSSYYLQKGLNYALHNLKREADLFWHRLAYTFNNFEVTTYSDYSYEQELSPVLRYAPRFALLFALALVGMRSLNAKKQAPLLIPMIIALGSILVFFYISRLRMPMIPALAIFAGHGAARLTAFFRSAQYKQLAVNILLAGCAFAFAHIRWLSHDSSNTWNKVGAVYRAEGKTELAEKAYQRALQENPRALLTYYNLAKLYDEIGNEKLAQEMRRRATVLKSNASGERFERALR